MLEVTEMVTVTTRDETRIDSRLVAQHLGSHHASVFELVKNHRADFEELGKVRFETEASPASRTGQTLKFALLTEDQCYLLLTYSRNTAKVRQLKVALVKAFRVARLAADQHKAEYLPTYHRLHDDIKALADGSPNERFVHLNLNKLVNRAAGLESGQRKSAPLEQQALVIVAQAVAARALQGASDHHAGYQRAKGALQALAAIASPLDAIAQ